MAVKKAKKKAVKRVAKKKDPSKSKAAQAAAKNKAKKEGHKQGDTVNAECRKLLLERKYTDQEICDKVQKKYPDGKFLLRYVGCKRWDLNHDGAKPPIERLVKHEGKLVPKSQVPKKTRSSRKKYSKDNDPLNKVAGIDVHSNKAAKKKAVKKVAKKKVATKKK